MTSKETLETLFEILCEREHTNSEHSFWLKLFNNVAKDLEALEIIKKSFSKNFLAERLKDAYLRDDLNDEDYEKIEEWLEK